MKILVCGGRHFDDKAALYGCLDVLHAGRRIELIVHGACPVGHGGADMLADAWAWEKGVEVKCYPINRWIDGEWPACGRKRNERMWRACREWIDGGVGFPGGNGTAHMVALMRAGGKEVWEPIKV